jgi:diguanylate cyclase (GGDEF)-like protein
MEARGTPLEGKIQRRFLPFAAVGLVAPLTALLPPQPAEWTLVWVAAALTVVIAAVGVAVPWSRVPRWTYVLPPLAYFFVVALLRHASEGSLSGYSPLALLPVVWIALNLGRREVTIGIVAGVSLFAVPLLGGWEGYGTSDWRRAILWALVAAVVGFGVEALMRDKRRQAREAREHAQALAEHERTMAAIAQVIHGQTSASDTRALICQAAIEVAGGNIAVIVEPDDLGDLVVTGRAGIDAGRTRFRTNVDPSGSAVVFASGTRFFVADTRDHPAIPQDVVEATGMVSALFEPILRDGVPVGVLAVGWNEQVGEADASRMDAVTLLAAEAASAIERADLLARLQSLAETDGLTGLPNRRTWDETIRAAVAAATRSGARLCVAVVDLDHFKRFNDEHGHQAGDRLLKAAAAAWRGALRETDTLARYGGEEFAVALPGCELEEAEVVLERLRRLTPEGLTCSIGLACWDGREADYELVARADAALYDAKRSGRDALVVAG